MMWVLVDFVDERRFEKRNTDLRVVKYRVRLNKSDTQA